MRAARLRHPCAELGDYGAIGEFSKQRPNPSSLTTHPIKIWGRDRDGRRAVTRSNAIASSMTTMGDNGFANGGSQQTTGSPPAHPLTVFVGTLHFSATLKGRVSPGGLVRDYKKQSLLIRAIGGLGVSREV